jgi:hypothetical protein
MKMHPSYHDVTERKGELYVGRIRIASLDDLDASGRPWLSDKALDKLPPLPKWRQNYVLQKCGRALYDDSGRWDGISRCTNRFICSSACRQPSCRACREQGDRERKARFIEKRSRARANARYARPPVACAVCGEPIAAERSTRRYCSDKCRQRAHRGGPVP